MRTLLVDVSVFITLSEISKIRLLDALDGEIRVPKAVAEEIDNDPGASRLSNAADDWLEIAYEPPDRFDEAAIHLGRTPEEGGFNGNVALLVHALENDDIVVITDDKPLRGTCKALGIEVSGSIGVVIAAVERGDLDSEDAKDALVAMDEVGARLSAGLLKRAERLIDEATEN